MGKKQFKVAIIEDDITISQMYRFKFEAEGYQVETASNGKLGLALAEDMKPDIILLDLMMPGMDGFGFLKKMNDKGGLSIPVVVCSNISDVETINRAIKDGAQDVLLKVDYSGKQLVDKVSYIVEEFYNKKKK